MNSPSNTTCRNQRLAALALLVATGCGEFSQPSNGLDGSAATPAVYILDRTAADLPREKQAYTLAGSIYAGWMPWYYARESGVLAKWAEREGIEIELVSLDYVASIEAFVSGRADACLVTNMDALGFPSAAGIDTTVLIIGDYSNGNDKLLTRGIESVAGLRGEDVMLVELSVSDYLLSRALDNAGMSQRDVRLVNTGDSKIAAEFLADKRRHAVVTWNPIASSLAAAPGVNVIYDSSHIPGEILDLCVVNTDKLERDPRLGRALVGAWYEVLSLMRAPDPQSQPALAKMAELAGSSVEDFERQLQTTAMFWTPVDAVEFAESPELRTRMEPVRQFCFAKNLLGEDTQSVDDVGIAYPDGSVQGDPQRIKLRFDTSYAERAQ